jgi:hypothetical protein
LPRTSIEAGIQIEFSDEQFENADSSIRVRWQPDSNGKVRNERPLEKQDLPRTLIEAGFQIDLSNEQLKTVHSSIRVR